MLPCPETFIDLTWNSVSSPLSCIIEEVFSVKLFNDAEVSGIMQLEGKSGFSHLDVSFLVLWHKLTFIQNIKTR